MVLEKDKYCEEINRWFKYILEDKQIISNKR